MSGTEFIVAAIICVLFGSTCYWLGYGYGKDEGLREGAEKQKKEDDKTINAFRINLDGCRQDLAFRESAIDAMKDGRPTTMRLLTAGQVIDLARHRGKEC